MTAVFIHGNPETDAIWTSLIGQLGRPEVDHVVRVSPPGFGSPLRPDSPRAPGEYAAWLAARLEEFEHPVDVVAHDWGAGHLFGVLDTRPELVRSWVADVAGMLHPDYEWHEMAQLWQTPGAGEDIVDAMMAMSIEERLDGYGDAGIPPEAARAMAEGFDADMASSVLSLYRGAQQPYMANLGERLVAGSPPPGLVIVATEDAYAGDTAMMRHTAAGLGADTCELDGLGHWWMCEDPLTSAQAIERFWASLAP